MNKNLNYSYIFFLLILLVVSSNCKTNKKNIAVIGTGYVGLIVGAGLADMGHTVICADIDANKINMLNNGKMPIYEPGLANLVKKNVDLKLLSFTCDVSLAIQVSDIIIISVGTPQKRADLSAVKAVACSIAKNLNSYKVVCVKSTVPVGTNKFVKSLIKKHVGEEVEFDVISNPEFLRAGSAIRDFFECNPIVLGSDSEKALNIMEDLYIDLINNGIKIIKTNFEAAETIKYAWNSFGAIKIAYINELSRFCATCGADIFAVIKGMSLSDKLLPAKDIKPGPGIGGSCLPKDTRAFIEMAKKIGVDLDIVNAYITSNKKQKQFIIKLLYTILPKSFKGSIKDKTIGVLGLSFKPNTDDIRMSPAIDIISHLLDSGAKVKAYDPKAMDNIRFFFNNINLCDTAYQAIEGCDVLILLTEWDEFKKLDLDIIKKLMNRPIIIDGRNMFDPSVLREKGFISSSLGRV